MPIVYSKEGHRYKKEFPYTPQGRKEAREYAKKLKAKVFNTLSEEEKQKKQILEKMSKAKGDFKYKK